MRLQRQSGELRVAPFAGAWIEILRQEDVRPLTDVAPFAGAWIEICPVIQLSSAIIVAPFAGAWIEITRV